MGDHSLPIARLFPGLFTPSSARGEDLKPFAASLSAKTSADRCLCSETDCKTHHGRLSESAEVASSSTKTDRVPPVIRSTNPMKSIFT